jgi:hypothetical protein
MGRGHGEFLNDAHWEDGGKLQVAGRQGKRLLSGQERNERSCTRGKRGRQGVRDGWCGV